MGAVVPRARAAAKAALERVLALFPRLAERRRQLAGTLSGGEQQMLAIARCLMGQPRLIMLDEPSLGLAPVVVAEVFRIIRAPQRATSGLTILLVEQNVAQSLALAHRGYVLENGRIVIAGIGAGAPRRRPRAPRLYRPLRESCIEPRRSARSAPGHFAACGVGKNKVQQAVRQSRENHPDDRHAHAARRLRHGGGRRGRRLGG